MMPYEIHLAHRNLMRHPCLTLAMVGGLALAVLVMVYIPSTMASFYDDMIARTVEQNSAHVTIWPLEKPRGLMTAALREEAGESTMLGFSDRTYPRYRDLNGQRALARRVTQTPGVSAVADFVRGNGAVSRGKVNLNIVIEGIDPKPYARVVAIAKQFPDKRAPKLGPNDIAIGFRMAEKLGIHAGEHVHVATAQTHRLMRVRAIFHSGYYEKDLHHGYVALRTAQRMFEMGTEVSGMAVRCDDINNATTVTAALDGRLNHKIRNWRDDNASLLAEISMVQRVTIFVNVLVAAVSSVGMASVFSMFVLNRQKELAILRAVGASRLSLRGILVFEALFIWVFGTLVGLTASLGVMAYEQSHPYAVSAETYGISSYATHPKPLAFILACVLSAVTMVMSAWYSGRRAAKLNPIRVIFGR